jgi:hypothetical protein
LGADAGAATAGALEVLRASSNSASSRDLLREILEELAAVLVCFGAEKTLLENDEEAWECTPFLKNEL